jgi:hypothetical protein
VIDAILGLLFSACAGYAIGRGLFKLEPAPTPAPTPEPSPSQSEPGVPADPPVTIDDWTPGSPHGIDLVREASQGDGVSAGTITGAVEEQIERSIPTSAHRLLAGGDAAAVSRGEQAAAEIQGEPSYGALALFTGALPELYRSDLGPAAPVTDQVDALSAWLAAARQR